MTGDVRQVEQDHPLRKLLDDLSDDALQDIALTFLSTRLAILSDSVCDQATARNWLNDIEQTPIARSLTGMHANFLKIYIKKAFKCMTSHEY